VRFTEEVKAIVAENLAMKAELALRNKIVHALYESEPQLRARYQDEAEAGHFASIDSSFVPTEDLRRRLVALYSGTLHGKLQKIK
jgi:hypothetical protein